MYLSRNYKAADADDFPKYTHRIVRVIRFSQPGTIFLWSLLFCTCYCNELDDIDESPVKSYSTSTVSNSKDWFPQEPEVEEDIDVVTQFLRYVDKIERDIEHCHKGTWAVTLPRGAVSYGTSRYMAQASKTCDWANFYTRIWKNFNLSKIEPKEELFFNAVISIVENDDKIFAAGNCYDEEQFKDYELFCPYAYRKPDGMINVKDLSVEYKYLSNQSEWFYEARMNAQQLLNHSELVNGKLHL